MSSAQIFITGATGFVGQHLVNHFLANNQPIRLLVRMASSVPDAWQDRVEIVRGDIGDRALLSRSLQRCAVVCHLAGELRHSDLMHTTNVVGIQNLLAACEQNNISRLVLLSSVGVIGSRISGDVDESAPCHPFSDYERTKYEAEQIALAWSARTKVRLVILRPTIIFGEGIQLELDSMLSWLRAIKKRRFVFFDHRAIANYVYVGDVAHACRLAVESAASGTFIVSDPCLLTNFVNAAADLLGVPPPRLFIPARFAAMVAFVMQTIWRGSPLTPSRVRALSNRTCYTSTRIQNELGWRPINGWREGLRRTILWYREQGRL